MKKIAIVTTMWSSINNWIKPFLSEYDKNGIDVTIICNMDREFEEDLKSKFPFVHTKAIAFPRGISVFGSLKSIRALKKFFKKNKFDMVQYSTPNASFYASIASKSAKIPVRLYCQWGMIYVSMGGIKRKVFRWMEKTICKNSTFVQPDSKGNLDFCREQGFYDEGKSCVIWNGSAKGLDLSLFDITKKDEYKKEIFNQYGLSEKDRIIGFVGRLGRDKGCHELFKAFKILKEKYSNLKLLFVGPIEKQETIESEWLDYFFNNDDIIKTGRVNCVQKYTSCMEVFVLPSYREGFGMGVIEASAMGVPVVTTKYPGPSSAMLDEISGFSVDVKNVDRLVEKIDLLLSDNDLREKMGKDGRKFVEENFDQKIFIQKYMENRLQLLNKQ